MPRANGPPALNLSAAKQRSDGLQALSASTLSPTSPKTPQSHGSMPASPFPQGSSMGQNTAGTDIVTSELSLRATTNGPGSPSMITIPQYTPSPSGSPKHARDTSASKSFFSNLMASKSSHRLHSPERNGADPTEKADRSTKSRASSKDRTLQSLRNKVSTPELPKTTRMAERAIEVPSESQGSDSQPRSAVEDETIQPLSKPKTKPRFGGLLGRKNSVRVDDGSSPRTLTPDRPSLDPPVIQYPDRDPQYSNGLKSAPMRPDTRDRGLKEPAGSSVRNRSADRPPMQRPLMQSQENLALAARRDKPTNLPPSGSFRDGSGSHLLSNIHQTGRGMGARLGTAGKGFFGKITRSGSSNERELVTDDNYGCTVINLPLIQQTRRTRIAKRLESSRDKTEYWMPALPWRCIDYLNMNGCEEEGLYRIPGSGKDVKHWQRRFDTEYDINLFDEPDLYDINTIGSMFKSWLRELPDEIFPKAIQLKISERCTGVTTTPQLLKDELSMLPPFNYYLLFAITCHLSLLHSFADKNKMDYRNLCICFQPCLKIDGFCFQFLVQDWKNCWQGCWTEKEFLDEENRYEREGTALVQDAQTADERAVSSSDSSQHPPASQSSMQQDVPRKQLNTTMTSRETPGHINGNSAATSTNPTTELSRPDEGHSRSNSRLPDLRPLSVLKM